MTGDFETTACNDDAAPAARATAEIELRLANIIAAVREVAIAAEERLREVSQHDAAARQPAGLSCAPYVIEASRVQIGALQALLGQGQRLAA
jgi:hypothetical protein